VCCSARVPRVSFFDYDCYYYYYYYFFFYYYYYY